MNATVANFLKKGKAFRASKNSGDVIIVENDAAICACVKRWAFGLCRGIKMARSFEQAMELNLTSSILIVGLDSNDELASRIFLSFANSRYPSAYIVAYTKNWTLAKQLQEDMPRITVIITGDAADSVDDLMDGLDSEIPTKLEAIA